MRSEMHSFYIKLFKDHDNLYVVKNPSILYKSNNWLSRIIVERKSKRISTAKIREQFLDQNIETRHFWKPMHLQPIFKDAPYYGDKVSESLFKTGLCLPSGSNLTLEDKDRIRAVIAKFE
jgi:dTDP-4-amino-4,6-dideoxygalactose transaminase